MKLHTHPVAGAPAISVVLPTHNGSRFIDQAIDSIVRQTYQDWELIVVDDASTDDTPTRIDWWPRQDDRIRVVHLERNRTLPGALNEGFSRARGEYHTWTSDDNWYHPDALARICRALAPMAPSGSLTMQRSIENTLRRGRSPWSRLAWKQIDSSGV